MIYLANVIPPAGLALTIVSQKRNRSQSIFRVDFRRIEKTPARSGLWIGVAVGIVLVGALLFARRRRA